jgi:hypothetical protein
MFNNSKFNAYGGSMERAIISVSDSAILNLYNLVITPDSIYTQGSLATINVYGKNFIYEQYSSDWWLHGNWSNNEEFILKFRGPWTRDYVILHEIPEPSTIFLLIFGALGLSKKNK